MCAAYAAGFPGHMIDVIRLILGEDWLEGTANRAAGGAYRRPEAGHTSWRSNPAKVRAQETSAT